MTNEIQVRQMTHDDLHAVARVHSIAFSGFFLDAMGQPFLRGYYDVVLRYSESIALVAEDSEGHLAGFAVGFVNPTAFYSFLKSQWLRLLPVACFALVRRPHLFGRIVMTNLRVRKKSKPAPTASKTTIELASIAVASNGMGVGSRLLHEFLTQTKLTRGTRIALTTDLKDNSAVQNFYRKHGFVEAGIEKQGTREMLSFVREVCQPVCELLAAAQKK